MKIVEQVINLAGGASVVARACGVSPQAVQQWRTSDRIPAERVLTVEKLVNGQVSRYEIRPDVYGDKPGQLELSMPMAKG